MARTKAALLFFLAAASVCAGESWQSQYVSLGADRRLVYSVDGEGNRIPDFSHAGYKGGGVPLPYVPVVQTIGPVPGDNTTRIQAALDAIGALPKSASGFRGALLLTAGEYVVSDTLFLRQDGIVLRGTGDGGDPTRNTILVATGNQPAQRTVLIAGSKVEGIDGNPTHTSYWAGQETGTKTNIVTSSVPVGSRTFDVEDATKLAAGDNIVIVYPASTLWIQAVSGGGTRPDPVDCAKYCPADDCPSPIWVSDGPNRQQAITFNRTITEVMGKTVSIDAPVYNRLERSLSQAYVYKYDRAGLVSQVGIESLRVDIRTNDGQDEAHAWNAIGLYQVEDAWVRDCTTLHFALAGVRTATATRVTVENCKALDPVAMVAGGRMYNFDADDASQLVLFRKCVATNGRHHYVSNGTSLTSGIVFLDCTSSGAWDLSEGHRRWTMGLLYDNLVALDGPRPGRPRGLLGLYSRGCYGPSQGWSAAHSVAWRCDLAKGALLVQKPPTAQNYAIGCFGTVTGATPPAPFPEPAGAIEGTNSAGLTPRSLYEAQLAERLGIYQVPVVVNVLGAGSSHFTSDLTISNGGASAASVVLSLNRSPGGDGPPVVDVVPAGRELRIPDVIRHLRERGYPFPADSTKIAGSLTVRFAESWEPERVAISSRVSTPNPGATVGGSFGVSFPAEPTARFRQRVGDSVPILGLRESANFRSNLAIADVPNGTGPAALSIQLYDGDTGRSAGAAIRYTLQPGEWKQLDSVLGPSGVENGYAVVTKIGGGSNGFLAYGVVNDGAGGRGTSDGTFSSAGASSGLVPIVLRYATYTSELVLANPTSSPVEATLTYTPSDQLAPGQAVSRSVPVGAGIQIRIPDVITFLGASSGPPIPAALSQGGTLRVSNAAALVRTSSANPDTTVGGTFGVGYPAYSVAARAVTGAWVFGLRQDAEARSNLAIADARVGDPSLVSYLVEVFDSASGSGGPVLVLSFPLSGGQWVQVSGILARAGLSSSYVHVEPERPSDFVTYGVINDGAAPGRGTSDGSYVAMSGVR